MRRYLIVFMLLPMMLAADPPITSIGEFKTGIRRIVGIEDVGLLPDTSLTSDVLTSLVHTSIDVGGIQAQYRIITVANQAFYAIPDTICEVLTVSFIASDGGVYAVAPLPPELYEQTKGPPLLTDESQYSLPLVFNWWSDTIQLMPQPAKADDSVILKCHVEYSIAVITTADSSTLQLKAGYVEAATFYCAYLTSINLKMFDEANVFLGYYETLRRKLRARYQNQFAMPVKDAP